MVCNIVIVGGGIMGSAIAYFLASNTNYDGSVTVVEKDQTYSNCSTTRSLGSIRQQFSTPENISMSKFGYEFLLNSGELLQINDDRPQISLIDSAYLVLASIAGMKGLQSAHQIQTDCGAEVELLDAASLARRFPWLNTAGLSGGCQGLRGEGWFDPYALLIALKKKSVSLGVHYIEDEAVSVHHQFDRVSGVTLKLKGRISCKGIVNAAGPVAGEFAMKSGIDLPVTPRKRCVFFLRTPFRIDNMPLVVDPSGMYVRPEGEGYLCGYSPPDNENDPVDHSLDVDYDIFESILWPELANRIPQFETLKMEHAWAGHYDFNSFDQNGIVGVHPEITNYYMANGFSGHGVQQAPAVGRAISELIVYGKFLSLDLSRLGYQRIPAQRKYDESVVI